MRASWPIASASCVTSAPVASATSAIALMNEILVARNAFARHLDELGGGVVGDDARGAGGERRGVDLVEHGGGLLAGLARGHAVDEAVGREGVLHGEALAQELGVPGERARRSRASLTSSSARRAAVPTGTVDLPTTRSPADRCGSSAVDGGVDVGEVGA